MSWRKVYSQPDKLSKDALSAMRARSEDLFFILHLADVLSVHALQESRGLRHIEFGIAGFDAQEETIGGGARKTLYAENRVIGLRQPVQRQHAHHSEDGRAQNGKFERDRNKRRPTI